MQNYEINVDILIKLFLKFSTAFPDQIKFPQESVSL